MVLYHAVSSYQLLEVMLHRMTFHEKEKAVLILPDFITDKYPQYKRLQERGLFDEVYLFPYLRIPHKDEKQVMEDVNWYYNHLIPHNILEFSKIYVAGAHFYFSLYLLRHKQKFSFFEDAAGMLSHAEKLYQDLRKIYPLHANIAKKYGLFDGSNDFVEQIICLKKAQTKELIDNKYQDFSVEEILNQFSFFKRRKIIRFFVRKRLKEEADAILLTQSFVNLGIMNQIEQKKMYQKMKEQLPLPNRLLIKKHPDDDLVYTDIFPEATVIQAIFPAELLPYVFHRKPDTIYTFDSTGCENLEKSFTIVRVEKDEYEKRQNLDHCQLSVPASDSGTYEEDDAQRKQGRFAYHRHHPKAKRVCATSEGNGSFSESFIWTDHGIKQSVCNRK